MEVGSRVEKKFPLLWINQFTPGWRAQTLGPSRLFQNA